jgi:hypothetical protein
LKSPPLPAKMSVIRIPHLCHGVLTPRGKTQKHQQRDRLTHPNSTHRTLNFPATVFRFQKSDLHEQDPNILTLWPEFPKTRDAWTLSPTPWCASRHCLVFLMPAQPTLLTRNSPHIDTSHMEPICVVLLYLGSTNIMKGIILYIHKASSYAFTHRHRKNSCMATRRRSSRIETGIVRIENTTQKKPKKLTSHPPNYSNIILITPNHKQKKMLLNIYIYIC